jgi:hypothetical protein
MIYNILWWYSCAIIHNAPCDKYDAFQHINFTFSQILISLFDFLFNN